MAVPPLHHLAQTFTFRALSSSEPDVYLAGVEDGLSVAVELLKARFTEPSQTGAERPVGSPLRALQALDLLLDRVEAPSAAGGTSEEAEVIHLEETTEPAATFSLDIRTNWVAALAVGVVHNRTPVEEDVSDILDEAGRDRVVLRAARTRLARLASLDEQSRLPAVDLLDDALRALDSTETADR